MSGQDELVQYVLSAQPQAPRRQPGQGITASELGANQKKSRDWGRDYLNKLVDYGLMKRTMMTWTENGHSCTGFVYEKP